MVKRNDTRKGASETTCYVYGLLAYARGTDRSPSHDPDMAAVLRNQTGAKLQACIRSWEHGWDEGHTMARELRMENHKYLTKPLVIRQRGFNSNQQRKRG